MDKKDEADAANTGPKTTKKKTTKDSNLAQEPQKKHISFSQLSMFERCGVQWYNRYVLNKRIQPGIAQVRGTATHTSIKQNMNNKLETGVLLPDQAVREAARDGVVNTVESEGLVVDEEYFAGKNINYVRDVVIDHAVSLAVCHHKDLAPKIDPKYVEEEIRASEPEYGLDIVAHLDLVSTDGVIHDTKTSAKSPPKNKANDSMQLTIYDYAYRVKTGEIPKSMQLDVLVRTPKQAKVYVKTLSTEPRPKNIFEALFHRLQAFKNATKAGIFHPAPSDSWQCSQKYCGYWNECPFAQGNKR